MIPRLKPGGWWRLKNPKLPKASWLVHRFPATKANCRTPMVGP